MPKMLILENMAVQAWLPAFQKIGYYLIELPILMALGEKKNNSHKKNEATYLPCILFEMNKI